MVFEYAWQLFNALGSKIIMLHYNKTFYVFELSLTQYLNVVVRIYPRMGPFNIILCINYLFHMQPFLKTQKQYWAKKDKKVIKYKMQ